MGRDEVAICSWRDDTRVAINTAVYNKIPIYMPASRHTSAVNAMVGAQLLCPTKTYFKTGPQPDFVCGGCGSHSQNG